MLSHRAGAMHRWVYEKGIVWKGILPSWMIWLASRRFYKKAWAQGTARHSREEVIASGGKDLQALSSYLGKVIVTRQVNLYCSKRGPVYKVLELAELTRLLVV